MSTTTSPLPALLKLLGDEIRLRVLGLLAREELGVGELARILGVSSSRLGNHLRILREAGLVLSRREGSWTFVSLDRQGSLPPDLWQVVEHHLDQVPAFGTDCRHLEEVLDERRQRSRSYFDRVAGEWNVIGADFATGVARHRVAAQLLKRDLVVADVGCGTGHLAGALTGLVGKLILIDHSPAMLQAARDHLGSDGAALEFRTGEIDALPLEDGEVDALVAGMVLHHAPDLTLFFREAFRSLRPGGDLVVEDLLPHREAWMQETMADLRLGLDPDDLQSRMESAGFRDLHGEIVDDFYRPERPDGARADLPVFLVRGRKPRSEPPHEES